MLACSVSWVWWQHGRCNNITASMPRMCADAGMTPSALVTRGMTHPHEVLLLPLVPHVIAGHTARHGGSRNTSTSE
jgi:hypothetical protein